MLYRNLFLNLKKAYNQEESCITLDEPELEIRNFSFESSNVSVLPGHKHYKCERHDRTFGETYKPNAGVIKEGYPESLSRADCTIKENGRFRYSLFKKAGDEKADDLIVLFHGLNERDWYKYLPWAAKLIELTGRAVLLFPIAFHMNRAPAEWGNPRAMKKVSDVRNEQFPTIAHSTFVNAAISTRVQSIPQRFFWSGLQTYRDVIQLIQQIRGGKHEEITAHASIDLFAYSIGSFLSEILMLTNPRGLFDDTKLLMFCGGPTLDRMYPVSRYILDSEANIALYSFFIEHLDKEFHRDERLAHYFSEDHRSGQYFRAMLSYPRRKQEREDRFAELSDRIHAITLKQDDVVPPSEVMNTLQGEFRDIPIPVDLFDFPYEYSHVVPFHSLCNDAEKVDKHFNQVFERAAEFLIT